MDLCKLMRFVISAGYNFPSLEAEVSDFKHGIWNEGLRLFSAINVTEYPF